MKYTDECKRVAFLLQKGCEYVEKYNDLRKAYEYYKDARECLKKYYGEKSNLYNIVNVFDYIWEENQQDYYAAALKLAEAGELLDGFHEKDVMDRFTGWINENRDELLSEVVEETLRIFTYFDWEFSLENMIMQYMLTGNDLEEMINRTLIDAMGLPRRFHFLIKQLEKNMGSSSPDMRNNILKSYSIFKEMQNKDLGNVEEEDKRQFMRTLLEFWGNEKNVPFMKKSRQRIIFDIARNMAVAGDTEIADMAFSRIKGDMDDFPDIDAKIKIKFLECLLELRKENREEANKKLDDITEMVNSVTIRTLFIRKKQKKIEYLKRIEYYFKRMAELYYQIRGAEAAYAIVVRVETLRFEHADIHLDSDEHKKIILKKQQLEMREKRGEDVSAESHEIMDYFERISHGIFSFAPMKICSRLTKEQAVLEFTLLTDESDKDNYFAFVVAHGKISAVKLGERTKIDRQIEKLIQYIRNYAMNKYSEYPIRMLLEYHDIYETIWKPIGEILPWEISELFIAGAGDFNRIPFGLLPCFHWYDKFMEEEYHIVYVNNGKEILYDNKKARNREMVVMGVSDFGGMYPELPSIENEVTFVAKLLKVNPITGPDAVFKCLEKRAGIFHIATHSYSVKNKGEENEDVMEQVGLVFAGGELASARRISHMKMDGTELVVLSVCGIQEEKGTGNNLEAGIKRAFLNAGVQHIVLNLWQTDDNAAELLMKCFYDFYIKEKRSIEEALRNAKHYLRTKTISCIRQEKYYDVKMEQIFSLMRENEIPYAHPYYWAGFIVFGV